MALMQLKHELLHGPYAADTEYRIQQVLEEISIGEADAADKTRGNWCVGLTSTPGFWRP